MVNAILSRGRVSWLAAACLFVTNAGPAKAVDEIQVYNGSIAEIGQLTIQQHLNYVALGSKTPPFAGGIPSNRSLNGTPEFAYGVTDWWEVGLYLPFSIQDQRFYSDAFKVRSLFVSPNADKRNFFYGINFELSHETPAFAQTRWGMEIRPIIGVRNAGYELIVNPIVDIGFGQSGEATFTPAARVARRLTDNLSFGVEYYSDLGRIGSFDTLSNQQHTMFAVTDFKVNEVGVNFGIGYGLTPASDRWVVKAIIGYALPVEGGGRTGGDAPGAALKNPLAHANQSSLRTVPRP